MIGLVQQANNPEVRGIFDKMRSNKGKGGAQQPPPMQNVPQAGPGQGFFQRMDPAARQALLAAMMARSRMGRQTGA